MTLNRIDTQDKNKTNGVEQGSIYQTKTHKEIQEQTTQSNPKHVAFVTSHQICVAFLHMHATGCSFKLNHSPPQPLALSSKLCGMCCCAITFLNQTHVIDWCMLQGGSKNKHHNDTSLKEIGLRFQSFFNCSTLNSEHY